MKIFKHIFFKKNLGCESRVYVQFIHEKTEFENLLIHTVPVSIRSKELASGLVCTFSSFPMYRNLPSPLKGQ